MDNILLVAPINEPSGYGRGARDLVKTLLEVDPDLVCRNEHLGRDSDYEGKAEIMELCNRPLKEFTHVVQYRIPALVRYFPGAINICYFEWETEGEFPILWEQGLSLMDRIWVPSEYMKRFLAERGFDNVDVVPHALDLHKLQQPAGKLDIPELQGNYVFYAIAEHSKRKNLETLIKCFHIAFDPTLDTSLLIKTSEDVSSSISQIKKELNLYPNESDYSKEVVIHQYLSDDQIRAIHNTGDCFVQASFGEGTGLPLIEALAFNKPVITNEVGVAKELSQRINEGFYMTGYQNEYSTALKTFKGYNSRQSWRNVDEFQLVEYMREVYEKRPKSNLDLNTLSYKSVAREIKKVL